MSNGLKLAIIIFLLTLVVVVINPKTHKGIEISSSSNVVFKKDDSYINNQDLKISNSDNFKNSQSHKFNNVDGIKNTDTKFKNIDNIDSKSEVTVTDQDVIDYEKNLIKEYRRRKELASKSVKVTNNDSINENQPQIVLDPNYKKNNEVVTKPSFENVNKTPTIDDNKNIVLSDETIEKKVPNRDSTPKQKKRKSREVYEATIVWNKWKSDFHNKIHNDIAYLIPDNMPLGALYKYSFVIDKNGNVSDVNVKVLFPGVSLDGNGDKALQEGTVAFKKAIYNCGKRHFKGFPEGSQRESVKLELAVQMGFVNVYTNPGDFNDLERVFGFK